MVIDLKHGDGIHGLLNDFKQESIDLIFTDPPYSITANLWDKPINWNDFWNVVFKKLKPNGACLIFGNPPFIFDLLAHSLAKKYYRYDWIWKKERGSNFQHANRQPMKVHEHIHVFYKKQPIYNPIKTDLDKVVVFKPKNRAKKTDGLIASSAALYHPGGTYVGKFPTSILEFKRDYPMVHSTQKPWKLCEYLIKTYTNPGAVVVDPFGGYCSTAYAVKQLGNRDCYSYELNEEWYNKSIERLK